MLTKTRLELQKAENKVCDNELVIADAKRALKQAKSEKGLHVYNAGLKRKVSRRRMITYATRSSRRVRRASRRGRAALGSLRIWQWCARW